MKKQNKAKVAKERRTMSKPKVTTKIRIAKEREYCAFAQEHKFVIHPKGYDYYLKSFIEVGRCPCDPKRKSCPCDEAVEEVKTNGHCLCRLFWRSYQDFVTIMFK